jgi:tRNA pseudouridine38-40 synthase
MPYDWYAILHYDGRDFAGWQKQAAARTVQGELEAALEKLVGHRLPTHAAGRTDSGVHAVGQTVSFQLPTEWPGDRLQRALNALTAPDLWVAVTGPAPAGFHARKHAVAREYRYVIGCDAAAQSPFRAPYEWALRDPLDPERLVAGARCIEGTHDFRGLSAVGQTKSHYRCGVTRAEWRTRPGNEGFTFHIEADRFLHRMVRFLVGLMVDVARDRRPLEDIPRLLSSPSNQEASAPAPPQGLYFLRARYPQFDPRPSA